MTKDVYKVSQSKVKTYRRCRRAYHNKYVLKLKKKSKSRPLQFGTMIHKALETYFDGGEPSDYFDELRNDVSQMKLFAVEREQYGDIVEDCEDIITDYVEYWDQSDKPALRPIRIKGHGAEHHFDIEILPDIWWNGKIDMFGKQEKLRCLVEHKTYNRRPSEDDRWRNLQSTTYFHANDILGWKPLDAVIWDYIRSKPPARPRVLADGTLSSAKIDTLPSTLERAIEEHEGDPGKKLKATREMAAANRDNYFERIRTPVTSSVARLVFDDFVLTVREMADNHGKTKEMNIDRHCGWCDYEHLCRAELQGLDVDYVKEREYIDGTKVKETREEPNFIHKGKSPEVE